MMKSYWSYAHLPVLGFCFCFFVFVSSTRSAQLYILFSFCFSGVVTGVIASEDEQGKWKQH